mmetsp:Transcript_5406/g.7813  ORF Transcript_5406/g.7813 Transcript_5406/m.7813 type:complete len:156 (-) Transcript_5406:90-557(-)
MLSMLKVQRSSAALAASNQSTKFLSFYRTGAIFPLKSFSTEPNEEFANMSDDDLKNTSTIPGWQYVHNPPREVPRGALVGTVTSTKMDKTVNVAVNRYHIVPKYRKRRVYTRKFMTHDEKEVADKGDLVMIVPCQRISRHKHFMLREIIKAKGKL